MFQLRPYQQDAINRLRHALARHKRVILLAPTGAGKTSIAAYIAKGSSANHKHTLFLAHRTELLQQAQDRFASVGIRTGTPKRWLPFVNVASVQTLRNRLDTIHAPDIIIIDEAHLSMAASYRKIIDHYPNAYIIGLTATPRRLDGKGLGEIYNDIVPVASVNELTELGFLVPAVYYAPKEVADLSGIKTVAGDYNQAQLYSAFDKRQLYDGVVNNYLTNAKDKTFICYCVNIEHSKHTAEAFRKAGLKCEHLDGADTEKHRAKTIDAFRCGDITGICNVNLFTEGFDVPHVETIILNRATQSEALFLQMVGRGLRPYENKSKLIVLDHGQNAGVTHGFHDDDRLWSLSGKKKRAKTAHPVKLCPECQAMMAVGASVCIACNYEFPRRQSEINLSTTDEFVEITRKITPPHLRKKYTDMTKEELTELATLRGYKKGWVYHQLKSRQK